ncbi:MAG: AMP-binding protein [Actinomycetota bacterium]
MARRIALGELLHECATEFGDRPFLTIAETAQTFTYTEFETLTNRIAHGLRERFPADLAHVVIVLENRAEYLAASYALKKLDAVEVSVNAAMRGAPLARMIDQTAASVMITSGRHIEVIADVRESIPHITHLVVLDGVDDAMARFPDLDVVDFDQVVSDRSDHIVSTARDTDLATILFTSGTTGVSKGCMLSHRYAVRTAENMIGPFRLTADDCVYSPYPLSHIGPAYYDVLPAMMTGGRVVLRQRFSVSNFWPEVQRFGVTWFLMLGSVQQLLWAHPPCPEERDHQVTRCWSTPAPVPKADFDARFGLHLVPGGGYGSTDAGWVVVPQWGHPGGIVLPHFEVEIHDDHGDPVPPGVAGEMVVRPREPGVMSDGYFGMPERTVEAWRNLWFHTGDIARFDEDGYFHFMHRVAERIRVKGEMVSGFEVEEGVLTHPAVHDAAAIGVPGEFGEEDVKVFVVVRNGMTVTEEELLAHCRERMAKFMVPTHVVFLDDLPRTPTGKPEKGVLATM